MAIVSNEEVVVDLLARTDKLERSLAQAGRTVDQRLNGIEQRGSAFASRFGGLLAGISVGAAVGELAKLADESKQLDAQLRLATRGFGTFTEGMASVQRIAAETRTSLSSTAGLYGSFARSFKELGRSPEEAAKATEAFAKALTIGGASSEDAANATRQFGQALAGGILRAEEFNSVVEASPRVAKVLADSLGVTIGQLRQMVNDGKVTATALADAFTNAKITAGVDAEFKTLPKTFDQAGTAIHNAAVTVFGAFDRGGEFSTAIVNFASDGTKSFADLEKAAEDFGADTRAIMAGLANVFDPIGAGGNAVFDALGIKIHSVEEQIRSVLTSFDGVRNLYVDADNFGTRIENSIKRGLNRAQDRAGGKGLAHFQETPLLLRSDTAGDLDRGIRRQRAQTHQNQAARRLEGLGYIVPRRPDGTVDEAGIRRPDAAPGRPSPGIPPRRSASRASGSASRRAVAANVLPNEAEIVSAIAKDLRSIAADGGITMSTQADELEKAARNFQGVVGREGRDYDDPFKGVKAYDDEQAARSRLRDAAIDADNDAQDVRRRNVYELANTFETLFQEGTTGVWRSFKDQGLRTLALIAAQAAVSSFGKGGGGFGSLLGNLATAAGSAFGGTGGLPRLANGGSIAAGGMGGVDRNVLSVNGIPRAMISANERLSVANPNLAVNPNTRAQTVRATTTVHQHFTLDLRGGITTPQLLAGVQTYVDGQAAAAKNMAVNEAVRAGPAYAAQQRTFK